MRWLFKRSQEPSTWAGISALVTAVLGFGSGAFGAGEAIGIALPAVLSVVKAEAGR